MYNNKMSYLMTEIAIDTTFYYNLAIDSGKKKMDVISQTSIKAP